MGTEEWDFNGFDITNGVYPRLKNIQEVEV
jgi:hypothetical protein